MHVLLYDSIKYHDVLTIPHVAMQECEFALRPLYDIAKDMEHSKLYRHVSQLLSQLLLKHSESNEDTRAIHRSVNLPSATAGTITRQRQQHCEPNSLWMMGPISWTFGGMSTRPNAIELSEEEIHRVIPVIQLRARGFDTPISVDTFSASVADKAIEAGTDLINDVSAGERDPTMYNMPAKWNVPVFLIHMRGDSKTMMSKTD
ncbi:MAG: Dihydropteroate synthase-like protein [Benniella sp.]|nr:MAG: Dihydropteroate synthase-like protein [Benniella sp.]